MDLNVLLEKCDAVSIESLSYEDWLEKRKGSIGGSDAGSILQLAGDYGSPLTVYCQKKGLEKDKTMSKAAMRGKLLEPVIYGYFAEEFKSYPLTIYKPPYMFYAKKYPFMSANVDGLIEIVSGSVVIDGKELSGIGILEIKTSKTGWGYTEDEVADTHYAQVQHYMSVLDLQWAVISVYMLEQEEIKNYVVLRNDEFIERLIIEEKKLWENFVIPGIMPAAIGIPAEDDMITGMYAGCEVPLTLTDDELALCQKINTLKEQISPLEEEKKAATLDLKAKLALRAKPNKEKLKLSAVSGRYSVSWSFFDQHRVDVEALKKAGLYEKFAPVQKADRLTVTLKKEK